VKTPLIVSAQEWEAAWQQLLVKEKELTRARDVLVAERRRMPWLAVEKDYEPGVHGWPEHACPGCSMMADQVAHLAHLHAHETGS
jgi:predicted dithiol-disulfide oxidoreductase (DUF899 family)